MKIDIDDELVSIECATVRDLFIHARTQMHRARTKAEQDEAARMMDAADAARERAGGNLDIRLRDICDSVWPASETRQ